jgi:hypothetical protein
MMDDARGSVPPERLEQQLAETKRRVGDDLRRTSSVPGEMFDACDPVVEAHLLDDGVVRKLLSRLNSVDQSRAAKRLGDAPPTDLERNRVTPQEIEEFFASLTQAQPAEPPNLADGLAQERSWILIDLARNASGLARQRATRELRESMRDLASCDGFDRSMLVRLIELLDEACAAGAPLLFDALRRAAQRALARLALPPANAPENPE